MSSVFKLFKQAYILIKKRQINECYKQLLLNINKLSSVMFFHVKNIDQSVLLGNRMIIIYYNIKGFENRRLF